MKLLVRWLLILQSGFATSCFEGCIDDAWHTLWYLDPHHCTPLITEFAEMRGDYTIDAIPCRPPDDSCDPPLKTTQAHSIPFVHNGSKITCCFNLRKSQGIRVRAPLEIETTVVSRPVGDRVERRSPAGSDCQQTTGCSNDQWPLAIPL